MAFLVHLRSGCRLMTPQSDADLAAAWALDTYVFVATSAAYFRGNGAVILQRSNDEDDFLTIVPGQPLVQLHVVHHPTTIFPAAT